MRNDQPALGGDVTSRAASQIAECVGCMAPELLRLVIDNVNEPSDTSELENLRHPVETVPFSVHQIGRAHV